MNMNSLNLNHLYYFWLVAKEGSVRKAAQKINLTQPTLSDQIRTLEQRIGKDLFERKKNRLHLTSMGRKIFGHCSKMFHEGEKILIEIENDSRNLIHMKVGMLPEVSKHLVCDLLLPVLNNNNSFLSIVEAEYKYLLKDLKSGIIDILVTIDSDSKLPSIFKQKSLQEKKFVVVCAKKQKKDYKFPEILESMPYISYTQESHLFIPIQSFFNKSNL